MTIDWVDIAITILTTGFFSLIGFVWKFSHKVTAMEKDVQEHQKRIRKIETDHDKVMDRMYSMAKERAKLMTKESYHNYEDSKEMSRMVAMARYEAERKSRGDS
tara:strand:- start:214 stop:525 length:312 start_codon:yes stop_codon:yes gene_type:complete